MKKKYLLIISLLLILSFAGCGSDSSVLPVTSTPTSVVQPTPTGTVSHVISSLTELETKKETISAKDGGKVTEGNVTVEFSANSLETDTAVEIAKVNINGIKASNRNGVTEQYKISTGSDDVSYELKEPSTVRITADNTKMPLIWLGGEWVPVDYTYDPNRGEIVMEMDCLDEDINEWTEDGDEEGTVEQPLVFGIGTATDYQHSVMSSKNRFKVFYCDARDESYSKAIAKFLEDGYDYYGKLNYNKPIKSSIGGVASDYNYVYIYPSPSNPGFGPNYVGVAYTSGCMAFNKALLDINKPLYQSTCYHELLHLVQFSYTGRNIFPNWFDESMAVFMQYYAINRPNKIYDYTGGRWNYLSLADAFNSNNGYYEKYILWSYIINKQRPEDLHDIMKDFKPYTTSVLNNILDTKFDKNLVTYFNECAEDYYIYGTFFNKTYFNNLKDRPAGQPYVAFINDQGEDPRNSSSDFWLPPLSIRYVCYESRNFKGEFKIDFSNKSSNFKVKFFYLKNVNGTYTVGEEDIGDSRTIENFGTDPTELFILVENTSISSDATATMKLTKM